MTREGRNERTERLLSTRLEELGCALDRSGATSAELVRRLELTVCATRHAVALELVAGERADAIWSAARRRHPLLEAAERRALVRANVAA